jgi:hypothetical protein
VVDYLGPLALNGTQNGGTLATHPYDNDNLNDSVRINNAVNSRASITVASRSARCMASRMRRPASRTVARMASAHRMCSAA